MLNDGSDQWLHYRERYRKGEWRSRIFRDMILSDAERLGAQGTGLTFLDIGCGGGFDSDPGLQLSLAQAAAQYIGVEPDPAIELSSIFSSSYRCRFEDADIEAESVDIAYAVMVLEHFHDPDAFWLKVRHILRNSGVFWGFTVDARHPFVNASLLSERLGIKDWYLDRLHGARGKERYENYGVFYRCNSPRQICDMTGPFASVATINFHRLGQMDYYLPDWLKWIGRAYDRFAGTMNWPGSVLAVRVTK